MLCKSRVLAFVVRWTGSPFAKKLDWGCLKSRMSGQETHEFGEPTLLLYAGFLTAGRGFQKRQPGSDQLFLCAEVQNG
jgi:hypothetical protein